MTLLDWIRLIVLISALILHFTPIMRVAKFTTPIMTTDPMKEVRP